MLSACRSSDDGTIPKSLRHQRVKPELVQRLTAARVVLGAPGQTVSTETVGQRRQERSLSEPLGPFLKILRQEPIAADGDNS